MSEFVKASREQSLLRLCIMGPPGSGKTFSSLAFAAAIAKAEGGRVGLVDTEYRRANKLADRFDFDVAVLEPPYTPERYIEKIAEGISEGFSVLILDSISHEWEGDGGCLDLHNQAVSRQKAANPFVAWKEVTPRHEKLIQKILSAPMHIICTIRSKIHYGPIADDEGRSKGVARLGMGPVQRPNIEYIFDFTLEMDEAHNATVVKETGLFDVEKTIKLPSEKWFADNFIAWLKSGAPRTSKTKVGKNLTKAAAEKLYLSLLDNEFTAALDQSEFILTVTGDSVDMGEEHKGLMQLGVDEGTAVYKALEFLKPLAPNEKEQMMKYLPIISARFIDGISSSWDEALVEYHALCKDEDARGIMEKRIEDSSTKSQ